MGFIGSVFLFVLLWKQKCWSVSLVRDQGDFKVLLVRQISILLWSVFQSFLMAMDGRVGQKPNPTQQANDLPIADPARDRFMV